jgi:hypothetical protein
VFSTSKEESWKKWMGGREWQEIKVEKGQIM